MVWLNDLFDGKFPIGWSLAIIGTLLFGSIVASWAWPVKPGQRLVKSTDDAAA
jgi:hypothetical protein